MGGVLVLLACLCWGLDNHLTALIDGLTPARATFFKGLVAGGFNLSLGLSLAPLAASAQLMAIALLVGALSYGASIALYIESAQRLGPTRAQGLFAVAPFLGAGLSFVLLGEPLQALQLVGALILIASAIVLLRAQHQHAHHHEPIEHIHAHRHDDGHHSHGHAGLSASATHTHWHQHDPLDHSHPHLPDLHHRHKH
jgi:drug/metabolite transporter (DMT)-like permease